MKFLLDTNMVGEPARARPTPSVVRRIVQHTGQIAISATSWHELMFGVARMPEGTRKRSLAEYFEVAVRGTMPILEYDVDAADWHGRERARLGARGRVVSFADGQIAAVAAVRGLTLVTANVRDFAAFDGLDVVNWAR